MNQGYDGVINIYKEKGATSRAVSSAVGKTLGVKAGHAGTLDPEAEGVLPVCVGRGTKLYDKIISAGKTYVCECTLGVTTDTQDSSGKITEVRSADGITEEKIKETIKAFIGGYEQTPPMFSALQVNGRRLYDIARSGGEVEREPRFVEITNIEPLSFALPEKFVVKVDCGKGTYIRTLCADLGAALGCGAHMSGLVRSRCGRFTLDSSVTLQEFKRIFADGCVYDIINTMDYVLENYK